jgi:hypothetical protein
MIHNLKAMGLLLGAFFAMSVIGASAASANQVTIEGGSGSLTGTDTVGENSVLKYNASQELRCHGHYHTRQGRQPDLGSWSDRPVT